MSASDGEKHEESKNNIRNTKKHQKTSKNIKKQKKNIKNIKKHKKTQTTTKNTQKNIKNTQKKKRVFKRIVFELPVIRKNGPAYAASGARANLCQ